MRASYVSAPCVGAACLMMSSRTVKRSEERCRRVSVVRAVVSAVRSTPRRIGEWRHANEERHRCGDVWRTYASVPSSLVSDGGERAAGVAAAAAGAAVEESTKSRVVLTAEDVVARFRAAGSRQASFLETASSKYKGFYSSVYGGFVTDYALMAVPMDDHMVHRGHAVFDTTNLMEGYGWGFDAHLDRFMTSAKIARIDIARLPIFEGDSCAANLVEMADTTEEAIATMVRARIRELAVDLIAFTGLRDGEIRFWMSSGVGSFSLGPYDCVEPSLYMMCMAKDTHKLKSEPQKPLRLITTSVPMKPNPYCVVKSTNYLQNCHGQMDAHNQDADYGIFTYTGACGNSFISEGPNCNVAFIDTNGVLIIPSFEQALRGVTLLRTIELVERKLAAGAFTHITGVCEKEVKLDDVKTMMTADDGPGGVFTECMIVSSGHAATPVSHWDGIDVSFRGDKVDGLYGPGAAELRRALVDDMDPESDFMAPIAYD